ncbi:MAG: hypothetical protein IJ463_02630 [Bacilli bacterium]|nr:hypothetical protein [Bacilli bacterium]
MLVDKQGNPIGTKGDMYTKVIMDHILQNGCIDHDPRPHYEDKYPGARYDEDKKVVITAEGKKVPISEKDRVFIKDGYIEVWVPAHTISVNNGVECTYDLSKGESPMITLRPIATKASAAEILWIYQQQSNDLVIFDEMLGRRTWEEDQKINNWWNDWALRNKDGSYKLNEAGHPEIGACYGGTTGPRNMLRSEVINVIKGNIEEGIKPNPDSRRLITCLWQTDDFRREHGLKPCAFLTIWNVRHDWDGEDYLDMTMVQRSSDFATAGCINQVQYAELLMMVAKEVGMKPGKFTWKPVNVQLYDRHLDQAIEMLRREPISDIDATIKLREEATSFDEMTSDDLKVLDKEAIQKVKIKNPQLPFPLGI